jgi:hypothetical protein
VFHPIKKVLVGIAGLAALALGGSALAGATTSHSGSGMPQTTSGASSPPAFRGPRPGTAAHEDAEKPVTGAAAAKARAAAVKNVGSGSAGSVTTDMTGKGFETTVTKSDGTKIEVHLDSSYDVSHGPGGPGRPGARGGWGARGGPPPGGPPPAGYGG